MKEMTKYSRVAGYLEKLFDMLNADLFDGELDRPIITLIPSSRSYGHYVPTPIWSIKDDCKHELNIATATLNRPIEYTIATLVHEMCTYTTTKCSIRRTAQEAEHTTTASLRKRQRRTG